MVGDYLRMHGFSVSLCDGGKSLRTTIAQQVPDLIVLDLNMPEEDGLSIIRDLKKRGERPGHHADRDRERDRPGGRPGTRRRRLSRQALRTARAAGPHPRGAAAERRRPQQPAAPQPAPAGPQAPDPKLVRFGTKWLDQDAQVLRDEEGHEHPLTASEYGLLKVFAANPRRVLSRDRLLELANARDAEAFDRAIDLRIMRIRRKIEPNPVPPVGHPDGPRRGLCLLPRRRNALATHRVEGSVKALTTKQLEVI